MKTWVYRLLTCVVMTAVGLGIVVCAASREVVLTVGFVSDSYWDAPLGNCYAVLDAAIDRFENKHPGVRVTYTSGILKEDYSEWLAGQYLLGKEPDVFMVLPEDFDMMQDFGALEPLDTRIERDSTVQAEDFYHAALDSGKMGNTQYALPYECVPTLMFVNKTLLEKTASRCQATTGHGMIFTESASRSRAIRTAMAALTSSAAMATPGRTR